MFDTLWKHRRLANSPFILGLVLVLAGPVVTIVGLFVVLTAPLGPIVKRMERHDKT